MWLPPLVQLSLKESRQVFLIMNKLWYVWIVDEAVIVVFTRGVVERSCYINVQFFPFKLESSFSYDGVEPTDVSAVIIPLTYADYLFDENVAYQQVLIAQSPYK